MKGSARRDGSGHIVHYPSLGGCVNDVALVECFLKDEVGVPGDHIIKLTSSVAHGSKQDAPQENPSAWPTYENIDRAFRNILQHGQNGDVVYIHYSGHGARVRTVYEDLKGPSGFDEVLVPINIEVLSEKDQGRYIRDIEIAIWVQRFVDKGFRVTVVLDSCHAGSANRAVRDNVRGTGDVDHCVLPSDRPQAEYDRPGPSRQVKPKKSWLLEASGYTLFAACTAFQKAHEHRFAERKHGALTYFLVDALRSEGFIKPSLLLRRVSAMIQSSFSDQTPVLDGEDDAALFGTPKPRQELGFRRRDVQVLTADYADQRVELDHGDLHGVGKGAVYGILAEGEAAPGGVMAAKARVTQVLGLKSVAALFDTMGTAQETVKTGCRATLLKQAPEKRADIALVLRHAAPNAEEQVGWLRAFRAHVDEHGLNTLLWRLLPDGVLDSAALFITITDNGSYEVWDASQLPIPNFLPIQASEPKATEVLLRCITHLVKFRLIQRLGADSSSALDTPCRFELNGKSAVPPLRESLPDFSHDLEFPRGLEPIVLENGAFTIVENEIISLVFENKSASPVHFTLFDLQPTWGITKIYPAGGGWSESVGPGEKRNLPIQMVIPNSIIRQGGREISETLKAIVTLHPTSLNVLELPDLDEEAIRDSSALDFVSALDQLMETLSPYRHAHAREAQRRPVGSWEAYSITVRTVALAL